MDLDMWPLRALFLLLWGSGFWCNDCDLATVHFESRNFHSRFHWDEVKIPGREVRYSVKYHEYGEPAKWMIGCQNISETFCDLSSVMMDVRSKYFVKIMADELCLGEFMHFIPLEKTSLEAPMLSVITARSSLTVTLKTPMGPLNKSVWEIICWERCQDSGKSPVNYIVSLTHPESEAGKMFQNISGMIAVNHLDENTEYCGVALYELTHPSIKLQSENTTFCVTLAATTKPWIPVITLSAIVALFLLITLMLIWCQQHVTKKRNLPKALIMLMNTTPDFNPDPKVEIATVKVYTEPPQNAFKSGQALPNVLAESKDENAGDTTQDYHAQEWHCHSYTTELVAPDSNQSAKSCTSYSMVVGVMIPEDREELSSCANDSGLGDSISPGLSSCTEDDLFKVTYNDETEEDLDMTEPDSTSHLLVLPVSRGANGKLQFSSLTFQPVVNHSPEISPHVSKLMPAGERTLLLTDLVCMDESERIDSESNSDYKKTYLPNRVPQCCLELPSNKIISTVLLSDPISNYRENWVPGILPNPRPNERTYIVNDNHLHELYEQEEDINESPSETEANLLDGWMVQVTDVR